MKYEGYEIEEFTSDKPVVFDPPKRMVVWDDNFAPREEEVVAVLGGIRSEPVVATNSDWEHCAEIPEAMRSRRATKLEILKWLAQGNGIARDEDDDIVYAWFSVGEHDVNDTVDNMLVRKWDDEEWHEPTVDYMFGEGAE